MMAGYVLSPEYAGPCGDEEFMSERQATRSREPELLPWQAALMVACVTMAGLLHEHPAVMRTVVSGVHATQLRSSVEHARHAAEVLNAAIWLGR